MANGVSIVVCCHNSELKLPNALDHLVSQDVSDAIPWEIIVIDNNSMDNTSQIAKKYFLDNNKLSLRVAFEATLGLSYARIRGLKEAKYDVVSFIDDDNWVYPNWVNVVWDIMSFHPRVGACGGFGEALCEIEPPKWFRNFQKNYAVGPQGGRTGDITHTTGFLWGAGLTVRRAAWEDLLASGFRWELVDRQGSKLSTSGDVELCFALRLAGWHLWYEPRLRYDHFIPASRLSWHYLRRIHRAYGISTVGLDPYAMALSVKRQGIKGKLQRTSLWHALGIVKTILRHPIKLLLMFFRSYESDEDILSLESALGRLTELIKNGKSYGLSIEKVEVMKRNMAGTHGNQDEDASVAS